MQADDFAPLRLLLEMTRHSVFDHRSQVVPIFALRENALAERARPKAAFFGLAHFKNDLAHGGSLAHELGSYTGRLAVKHHFVC
jgi:hypothetical protein